MQYIVDNKGVKTSVIVPFNEWEKIISDNHKLHNKLKTLLSIKDGINEIKTSKKQGKKLQSLRNLLLRSSWNYYYSLKIYPTPERVFRYFGLE